MAKIVPKEIADHILPFNWDVRLVWRQEAAVLQRPLLDFDYLLNLRLWSSVPNRGMLFDISPREVIASPHRAPHQERRMLTADIRFPIDFLHYKERLWILDGVHRLARLSQMGADVVSIRVHSEATIPRITAHAEQGGGRTLRSMPHLER